MPQMLKSTAHALAFRPYGTLLCELRCGTVYLDCIL